ncbi:MAG: hypothetical protein ACOY0T_21120 [Myxococcota bacterium]
MKDVTDDLEALLSDLRRQASEEGASLDPPPPPPAIVLDAVRLRDAGLALAESVADYSVSEAANTQAGNEILSCVFLVAMKSARIAAHLEGRGGHNEWWSDGAPNLLLLSRIKGELRSGLASAASSLDEEARLTGDAALAELDRVLDPLISAIDPRFRILLDYLIDSGRAPSPFCILERN